VKRIGLDGTADRKGSFLKRHRVIVLVAREPRHL